MAEESKVIAGTLQLLAGAVAHLRSEVPAKFLDGLPAGWQQDKDMLVDRSIVDAAWNRALALTDDAPLGLIMAKIAESKKFGLLGYVASNSSTLREGYKHVIRYQNLLQRDASTWSINEGSDTTEYTFQLLPPIASASTHIVEFVVGSFARMGRLMVNVDSMSLQVKLMHRAQAPKALYEDVFGPNILFGQNQNALIIASTDLDRPIIGADSSLLQILSSVAETKKHTSPESISDQVKSVLRVELQRGVIKLDDVAAHLNMSGRSLRRRLSEEATSFQSCLDEVRFSLARGYLAIPHLSTLEIALLLGFFDAKSFYRAFPRWAGVSLSEYRAEVTNKKA